MKEALVNLGKTDKSKEEQRQLNSNMEHTKEAVEEFCIDCDSSISVIEI